MQRQHCALAETMGLFTGAREPLVLQIVKDVQAVGVLMQIITKYEQVLGEPCSLTETMSVIEQMNRFVAGQSRGSGLTCGITPERAAEIQRFTGGR